MEEAVDISYTKFHDQIDNNPYNLVQPPENQLYVGWTEPGEWFNITVQVAHAGTYSADLLYTSIAAEPFDGREWEKTQPVHSHRFYLQRFRSDCLAQWHHWNVKPDILSVRLPAGRKAFSSFTSSPKGT